MKPIWITLLVTPLILFVVAAVYLWWQRASMISSTKRRVLAWQQAAGLVFEPFFVSYFLGTARGSFDVWMFVWYGLIWVYGMIDGARRLWNEYKH